MRLRAALCGRSGDPAGLAGCLDRGAGLSAGCAPGDNLAIHVALERVPRGSVLVVATGEFPRRLLG